MTEQHKSRAQRRREQRELDGLSRYVEERLKPVIAREGWAVQAVGADTSEDPPKLGWAYTVGLTLAGLPELVIIGLPPVVSADLLNDLASRMVRDDEFDINRFVDEGLELTELANLPTRLVRVDLTVEGHSEYVALARRLFGAANVKALQVVWPDTGGRWPWNEHFDFHGFNVPVLGPVVEAAA